MKKKPPICQLASPLNPTPPEPSKQFIVRIVCLHCWKVSAWTEGDMPNQVEHFQMAHKDCKKPK